MTRHQLELGGAFRWTAIGQGGSLLIQFLSALPLSRLLGPHAFGIAAYTILVYTALGIVVDVGVTAAVARLREEQSTADTLGRLNLTAVATAGAGCALLAVLHSTLARALTGPSEASAVSAYLLLLVIPVLAMAFQAVPRGMLIRQHLFARLACADLSAMFMSYCFALLWVLGGKRGAAPLVLQLILLGLLRGALISVVSRWRPTFRMRASAGWKDHSSFLRGNWVYAVNTFLSRNADNLIVGKTLGLTSLGFYARAFSLFLAPFTQLQYSLANIMLRNFSHDQCPSRADAAMRYKRLVSGLSVVAFVIAGGLFANARAVVLTLFGSRWSTCSMYIMAFSVALLVQLLVSPGLWYVQARGPTKLLGVLGFANLAPLGGVVIGGFAHSPRLVAILYPVFSVGGTLAPAISALAYVTGVSIASHLRLLAPGIAGGLGVAGMSYLVRSGAPLPDYAQCGFLVAFAVVVLVLSRRLIVAALS